MSYANEFATSSFTGDMNTMGSGQLEPLNLGPNIFLAQPGDLPPDVMQSKVPTVRQLPDKIEKKTLPPQYKTENLPPKIVKTKGQPIFPPGVAPTSLPNF